MSSTCRQHRSHTRAARTCRTRLAVFAEHLIRRARCCRAHAAAHYQRAAPQHCITRAPVPRTVRIPAPAAPVCNARAARTHTATTHRAKKTISIRKISMKRKQALAAALSKKKEEQPYRLKRLLSMKTSGTAWRGAGEASLEKLATSGSGSVANGGRLAQSRSSSAASTYRSWRGGRRIGVSIDYAVTPRLPHSTSAPARRNRRAG